MTAIENVKHTMPNAKQANIGHSHGLF